MAEKRNRKGRWIGRDWTAERDMKESKRKRGAEEMDEGRGFKKRGK